jgi:hypothetical protein
MNSNTSVTITWVAPSDGGSAVTAYSVAIRQSDGTTSQQNLPTAMSQRLLAQSQFKSYKLRHIISFGVPASTLP